MLLIVSQMTEPFTSFFAIMFFSYPFPIIKFLAIYIRKLNTAFYGLKADFWFFELSVISQQQSEALEVLMQQYVQLIIHILNLAQLLDQPLIWLVFNLDEFFKKLDDLRGVHLSHSCLEHVP